MFAVLKMKNTPNCYHYSLGAAATKRIICATATTAATLGTLSGTSSCWAFVASPPPSSTSLIHNPLILPISNSNLSPAIIIQHHRHCRRHHQQQSRLLFSQKGGDDNSNSDWETFKRAGANLLAKGAEKVKSLLPFGISGKSDEEKRADIIKKERKEEITGGISTLLKDLPLPIRMMGRMVSPLLARAAEEIAEQSQQAQDVFEEARIRLINDPYLAESLGEPIQVGQPFSQSSSTVVINGQRSATVRASFPVAGTRGRSGIATLESNNGNIRSLTVNVNGRTLSVGSSRGRGGGGGGGAAGIYNSSKTTTKSRDDNIIEAEIIEKK